MSMSNTQVFISYSHNDIAVTEELARHLENVGLKCWYAPRDIAPGADWAGSIVSAIQEAPYFVLIFSDSSNESGQVYKEVDMVCKTSEVKHTVINFRISNAEVSGRLSYYINSEQWVDATEDPDRAYITLARQIREGLGMGGVDPSVTKPAETAAIRRARKEQEKQEEAARKEEERAQKEKKKEEEAARKEEERLQKELEKKRLAEEKEQARQARREKWKKFPIKKILITLLVVFILAVVLVAVLTHKETVQIRLNDFVSVEYEGYDSYGTASLTIDYDGLEEALSSAEWKRDGLEALYADEEAEDTDTVSTIMESYTVYDVLISYLGEDTCTLSSVDGLSNGDMVELFWAIDEGLPSLMNQIAYCSISYTDEEFVVEGLTEIETYDPFDALTLSFSGMSGEGTAEYSVMGSGDMAKAITYSLSETKGLSNGQTVTVSVTNDPDEFEAEFGVSLVETERDYTVTGLSSYVADSADISEDAFSEMCSEVEDHFYAYAASTWDLDLFTLLGMDCIGYYFLTEKSESSPHNLIFIVYQVNVEYYVNNDSEVADELLTYYYYGGFEDLVLLPDGSVSLDYQNLSTPSEEFSAYDGTFYGYKMLGALYSDVVTTRIGDYTYNNLVENQDFGYAVTHAGEIEGVVEVSYVADSADIPETVFSKMRSETEDHFNAYAASNWDSEKFTLLGLDYIGYYFLSEKSDFSPHNMVFVVYQVNVEYYAVDDTGTTDELFTYYYYGGFEDLMLLSDGSVSLDYQGLSTPSEKFSVYDATFYGYQSLDTLFREVVTTRIGDYTSDNQVEDQNFGYTATNIGTLVSEETTEEAGDSQGESSIVSTESEETDDSSDGAYLGITGADVTSLTAETYDMPEGIYIRVIIDGSAASDSGLRKRDIITAIDGQAILTMEELRTALRSYAIGDEVLLTIQRLNESEEYEEMEVSVVLGDYSAMESYNQSTEGE